MGSYFIDSAKGIDTALGSSVIEPIKTMVGADKLVAGLKVGDTITISGTPVWGVQIGVGELGPIFSTIPGIIQYHFVPGVKIRTVIQIDKTLMNGSSITLKSNEFETMIAKIEIYKPIAAKEIKL